MPTATCLCTRVKINLTGPIGPAVYCHCSQCRRASGSAFATNASIRAEYVEFAEGKDLIREYESSPGEYRAFCSNCGSPVYWRAAAYPKVYRIRLGTLKEDPGTRPAAHVYVGSKAEWGAITDDLPQYDETGPPALVRPA